MVNKNWRCRKIVKDTKRESDKNGLVDAGDERIVDRVMRLRWQIVFIMLADLLPPIDIEIEHLLC